MSPSRKNKSTSLAVLVLGCVLFCRPVNFVALNGRRAILSGAVLPALLSASSANAAEKAAAKPAAKPEAPKEKRISRQTSDGLKYSFLLPGKEFELQVDQPSDTAYYKRKDGSFITIKE